MNITKLKRLLAAATSWSDPTETIHAQQDLLDMLPELLAVVEAAEKIRACDKTDKFTPKLWTRLQELSDKLETI